MQTIDGVSKFCPQCHETKGVAEFGVARDRIDGLMVWCRECHNRKNREKYNSDPETRAHKADNQKRRLSDPVKHTESLEAKRKWYSEHYKDDEYHASELERQKFYDKSPAGRAKAKRYRSSEKAHEYQRVYHRTYLKDKYNNDPEYHAKVRAWFAVRNNKKRSNGGTLTPNDWTFLVDLAGGKCLKCGQETKLTIDHIKPVIADGPTNVWNIQPLCATCNQSKSTQSLDYRPSEYRRAIAGYMYSEVT